MTDVDFTANSFTIHAREKISTGDYENAEFHTTLEGSIDGVDELDEETRREVKAKLLAIHKDIQETVERAAENRLALEEHEDWGIHNGSEDDTDDTG